MKKHVSAAILLWFTLWVATANAQIVNTLPFTLQNGTTADATQVMANFNQIVNNANTNAAKNGINSDITALLSLSTPLTPVQGGSSVYTAGTGSGTANAQVVGTVSPSGYTLANGKRVVFIAGATNTGATTLNVSSTGATNVYKLTPTGSSALTGGEIVSGSLVEAVYDGTRYQLVTNNLSVLGPLTSLASASTTDLGTIPSHNVNITGTTTITAFGSTAVTAYPIYYLKFNGALTLTHNATSLMLPGNANITTANKDTAVALYLGSGNWQVVSYTRASGQTISIVRTVFTASGTFTKAANLLYADVEVVGGGGGGGGGMTINGAAGAGGGGGGYARELLAASSLGTSETVTVGAAGSGSDSAGAGGTAGGTTSFGAFLSATGGGLGATGTTTTGVNAIRIGGSGGAGSGGDVNTKGESGFIGYGITNTGFSGQGGSSMYGAGGKAVGNDLVGNSGEGYGAGASGAVSGASPHGAGNGTAGIVIVTEYRAVQ